MNIKNSKTKLILKYLAIGGAVTLISLASPTLPYYLLKAYFKNKKFQKGKFRQDLKRLQKRELIDYQELPNGKTKIILKKSGKKLVLQYDIDDIEIKKPKTWNGNWWMIIFDIPVKKRVASNALSSKLKDLEFYQLQKSVYIHPFPCENEIEFIASIFDVREHILILNIPHFEGAEKLIKHFDLY
mgnify:CR=1 FL=1